MNREEITEMAREAGPLVRTPFDEWCQRFAALAAAKEREACAKVCDELTAHLACYNDLDGAKIAMALRDAIRNRSNT